MDMRIIRPGQLTTVQDLGRRGYRAAGVPLSGAMDPFALRVANSLVGNAESAAVLEFALVGPEIEFSADTLIALGGADCAGLAAWKPVAVKAGERVRLGECVRGCRGYLSVAGGIDVPPVLGSRSTYMRGGFGGFRGRPLQEGDRLNLAEQRADPVSGPEEAAHTGPRAERAAHGDQRVTTWRIDPRVLPAYAAAATVRVLPGAQAHEFGAALFEAEFRVSPQSDRMGLRLTGRVLARSSEAELLSSAVMPGTVQVPRDGQPLVLMADAQTIGGYPQAAHVIGVDLPVVAQLRPGDTLRFVEVTLDEAHRLALTRDRAVAMLREGLAEKVAARALP